MGIEIISKKAYDRLCDVAEDIYSGIDLLPLETTFRDDSLDEEREALRDQTMFFIEELESFLSELKKHVDI